MCLPHTRTQSPGITETQRGRERKHIHNENELIRLLASRQKQLPFCVCVCVDRRRRRTKDHSKNSCCSCFASLPLLASVSNLRSSGWTRTVPRTVTVWKSRFVSVHRVSLFLFFFLYATVTAFFDLSITCVTQ